MANSLSGELRKALLNNTYDHDDMKKTLLNEWQSSYSYLKGYQDDLIGYSYYHFEFNDVTAREPSKIGKFWLDNKHKVCFSLGYDMIHVIDREEYRRSKFYMNYFSFQDLVDNYSIFKKMPIFIIDDKIIWDYELKIDLDSVIFRFPYDKYFIIDRKRNPITDEIVYLDHSVKILFVDNIFFNTFKDNRTMTFFNNNTNTMRFLKSRVGDVGDHNSGMLMCNIQLSTTKYPELGSMMYEVTDYDNEYYQITLCENDASLVSQYVEDIKFNFFWINNLHKHTMYTGEDYFRYDGSGMPFFVLQKDDMIPFNMPIISTNMIIMKTPAESKKNHTIVDSKMNTYYPNIYQLIDAKSIRNDKYEIYYFYKEDTGVSFTVMHEFYYRFLCNKFGLAFEQMINDIYYGRVNYGNMSNYEINEFNAIFSKILNYKDHIYEYGEIDFVYNYLPQSSDPDLNAFEYHVQKMKEWIRKDPFMLRDYVNEQNDVCKGSYHLWVSTIDLKSRLRTDTSTEFDDGREPYVFPEPMYVFAFRNDLDYPKKIECRIFVDGLMVTDAYQERKTTLDYIYIPVSQVKNDSFIEIEVFDSYGFETNIRFNFVGETTDIIVLEPDENIVPTIADLMFTDTDNNEKMNLDEDIRVVCKYDEGDTEAISDDVDCPIKFTRLCKFSLTALSSDVVGKTINVRIAKNSCGVDYVLARNCYPYIVCETRDFKMQKEYLRLYKNGRLIPDCRWKFYKSGNIPRVSLEDYFNKGDHLYIDITPYQYKSVYYQEEINIDHPIIDLTGYINKPFDIRYYDVYLNGRKLTMNNIVTVSPWSFTLFNIKTRYQLEIFEKDRDYEYFGLDYRDRVYYFSPNVLMESSFMKKKDVDMLIDDIINHLKDEHVVIKGNTDEEDPLDRSITSDYMRAILFYDKEILPPQWLNPDRMQFNKEHIEEEYKLIFDTYVIDPKSEGRNYAEISRKRYYPSVLNLDPDKVISGKENADTMAVFLLGHPTDTPEDAENITNGLDTFNMKSEPNLS